MMGVMDDQKKFSEIKKNIENSHDYFIKNFNRFHEFKKFVFDTSISDDDKNKLERLKKPSIEFNCLESMISRLRGEFVKHEPSINIVASDGVMIENLTDDYLKTMDILEAHLREIFFSKSNDSLDYKIYSDLMSGGFSAVHIGTRYANEMSFEQIISRERVFDPTLIGFDPLARESHKGDGSYCFEIIPKTKEEFEEEFGKDSTKNMKFRRGVGGFNWSYKNQDREITLVVDYYYKVRKKRKLVKLSNGHTILKKHYKKFKEMWTDQGFMEQMPIIVEERWTVIESIERCLVCEDKLLREETTFYKYLPIVFIDGNSVEIRQNEDGQSEQMTRPYVYHAKGVQQLKNFAGQSVAAEIENMVQHKFIVSVESIPEGYEDAYKNVQQASTLAYNAFYKDNPEVPLTPPREVQRTPTPPIVENIFMGTDRVTQTILGSYDAILGINDKQISGVAIEQGAMQSNAAAIPYLMGYINGLTRQAEIVLDLIPKIYVTPRSIPIKKADGKRSYKIINKDNGPDSIYFHYDANDFQVKIEAGVSTAVQKQVALEQIAKFTQVSPLFAEFINTMGLETILDNMDIRGIDHLKAQANKFMKELEEKKAQAAENPPQDPALEAAKMQTEAVTQIEMMKIEQAKMKNEGDMSIQAAKVAVEKQKADTQFLALMAKVKEGDRKLDIEEERLASEDARTAVEAAMDIAKHHHEVNRSED